MIVTSRVKSILLAACAGLALAACSDSSTEIASGGNTGPNPGTSSTSSSTSSGGSTTSSGGSSTSTGGSTGNCPTGTNPITVAGETHCQLSGTVADDVTLTAGNLYTLDGAVFVGEDVGADGNAANGNPVTLTIEPGVTVYGETLTSLLVITRGSQIIADGTATQPIIFTSSQDVGVASEFGGTDRTIFTGSVTDDPNTSEWGGIVINGRAPINTCTSGTCEAEGEGDSGFYGGDDPNDDSGVLNYVQVRYAGNPLTSNDELNAIAFQGVGRGTEIDFLQTHNGADDGVEFFGGTVDAKHVVITGADDDSLDWTDGWQGRMQYLLIIQNPNQSSTNNGIEADNRNQANDRTPRSAPQIANATILGSAGSAQPGQGILLRRGTAGKFWNFVVGGDFPVACLDLDDDPTFGQANAANASDPAAALSFTSTLLGCTVASSTFDESTGDPFDLSNWYATGSNNVVGTTSLTGGFINGPAEAAVTAFDPSTVDSYFDSVDYIGAVPGAGASENWTLNWTFGLNPDPECPAGTTEEDGGSTCVLEGTYTGDLRLVAGLRYLLRGSVVIGEDRGPDPAAPVAGAASGRLIVDAGVTVEAEDLQSLLIVTRGSQLLSNGTADEPVTFTAINPETRNLDTDTSLWGGIVINGRAPINTCTSGVCEAEGEGDSGFYGGNDPDDDSGQMFYTRVVYAGNPLTSNDELNAIAFQGVGRGTEIDFLQTHNGADDGVEFFGGTVDAKHVVITGADDDSLDWTDGWQGRMQFLLIIQNANQGSTNNGIEADNRNQANDRTPRSAPQIANATILGSAGSAQPGQGILLRRGTAGKFWNFVVGGDFPVACLDLDDNPTFGQANAANASDPAAALSFTSSLLGCDAATATFDESVGDPFDLSDWFATGANNTVGSTDLRSPNGGGLAFINGNAETNVTAFDPSTVDSFFESVDYIGAVKNNAEDWTVGWTLYLRP